MKKRGYKHYIEIMPAAYLLKRKTWQKTARSLPNGAYLLVTSPNNINLTKLMRTLTRSLRAKGRRVMIWTVE